jgi:hypothetical protein
VRPGRCHPMLVAGHWILPGDAGRMLAAAAEVAFDP